VILRDELDRLLLQIERDLAARSSLKAMLADADAAVAGRRLELRSIKARIKRASLSPLTRRRSSGPSSTE
jgi:hypothetical protein